MMKIWMVLAVLLLLGWTGSAQAQVAITLPSLAAPDLGRVIAGSSATTFQISPQGVVTRTSGNAIRLSNAAVTVPTLTISCGLLNLSALCAARYVRITIQPVPGTGAASAVMLRAGTLTGASFRNGAPANASSLSFDLNPMGIGTTTLTLGMDVRLNAGARSGIVPFAYTVTVSLVA